MQQVQKRSRALNWTAGALIEEKIYISISENGRVKWYTGVWIKSVFIEDHEASGKLFFPVFRIGGFVSHPLQLLTDWKRVFVAIMRRSRMKISIEYIWRVTYRRFWDWDKTADFRVGQNRRFWKLDKTADFGNETVPPILGYDKTIDFENGRKQPILKMRQNRRFRKETKPPICKDKDR